MRCRRNRPETHPGLFVRQSEAGAWLGRCRRCRGRFYGTSPTSSTRPSGSTAGDLNAHSRSADKLTNTGSISLAASDAFSQKNLNRSTRRQRRRHAQADGAPYREGVTCQSRWRHGGVRLQLSGRHRTGSAGRPGPSKTGFAIAAEHGAEIISLLSLADTMGWATPARIEKVVGDVRTRWPDKTIALHLHNTRGLAVANAHAGLRLGVRQFDSTVGGLGGCPFAGQKGRGCRRQHLHRGTRPPL